MKLMLIIVIFKYIFFIYRSLNKIYWNRDKFKFKFIWILVFPIRIFFTICTSILYSSDIPIRVKLSKTTKFPHGFFGIVINLDAEIGEYCTIFHQVTIGRATSSKKGTDGAPKIGNYCFIGSGAKIIGKIIIGDNCVIGANAVVNDDIPPNSTVVLPKSIVYPRANH